MNIYIDANVYLSFYHFTKDALEELEKLVVLLEAKKVKLLLSQQTKDEFFRNREAKIADAIKRFNDQKLNLQFPAMCKDYESFEELRKLQKQYRDHHAELLDKLQKDIDDRTLKADYVIKQLFDGATVIGNDQNIVDRARFRMEVGNPPGKNGSLGDAINWEALLESVKDEEDVHFISGDGDYRSPLNEGRFSQFLSDEWNDRKKSSIVFYRHLPNFFEDKYPDIKLASELRKQLLIGQLAAAGSFAGTHIVIAELVKCGDFTSAQANDIVRAAISNNQVHGIAGDEGVHEFLNDVVAEHEKEIDLNDLAQIKSYLQSKEERP